ncbi:MAG: hypothetical protein ACAI44_04810 [Candidatus Sericytochromatia bacterium]
MATIANILQEVRTWPEEDRLELLVQLAVLVKQQHTPVSAESLDDAPSVFELAQDLAGCLDGPPDLATNPRYMDGFGR